MRHKVGLVFRQLLNVMMIVLLLIMTFFVGDTGYDFIREVNDYGYNNVQLANHIVKYDVPYEENVQRVLNNQLKQRTIYGQENVTFNSLGNVGGDEDLQMKFVDVLNEMGQNNATWWLVPDKPDGDEAGPMSAWGKNGIMSTEKGGGIYEFGSWIDFNNSNHETYRPYMDSLGGFWFWAGGTRLFMGHSTLDGIIFSLIRWIPRLLGGFILLATIFIGRVTELLGTLVFRILDVFNILKYIPIGQFGLDAAGIDAEALLGGEITFLNEAVQLLNTIRNIGFMVAVGTFMLGLFAAGSGIMLGRSRTRGGALGSAVGRFLVTILILSGMTALLAGLVTGFNNMMLSSPDMLGVDEAASGLITNYKGLITHPYDTMQQSEAIVAQSGYITAVKKILDDEEMETGDKHNAIRELRAISPEDADVIETDYEEFLRRNSIIYLPKIRSVSGYGGPPLDTTETPRLSGMNGSDITSFNDKVLTENAVVALNQSSGFNVPSDPGADEEALIAKINEKMAPYRNDNVSVDSTSSAEIAKEITDLVQDQMITNITDIVGGETGRLITGWMSNEMFESTEIENIYGEKSALTAMSRFSPVNNGMGVRGENRQLNFNFTRIYAYSMPGGPGAIFKFGKALVRILAASIFALSMYTMMIKAIFDMVRRLITKMAGAIGFGSIESALLMVSAVFIMMAQILLAKVMLSLYVSFLKAPTELFGTILSESGNSVYMTQPLSEVIMMFILTLLAAYIGFIGFKGFTNSFGDGLGRSAEQIALRLAGHMTGKHPAEMTTKQEQARRERDSSMWNQSDSDIARSGYDRLGRPISTAGSAAMGAAGAVLGSKGAKSLYSRFTGKSSSDTSDSDIPLDQGYNDGTPSATGSGPVPRGEVADLTGYQGNTVRREADDVKASSALLEAEDVTVRENDARTSGVTVTGDNVTVEDPTVDDVALDDTVASGTGELEVEQGVDVKASDTPELSDIDVEDTQDSARSDIEIERDVQTTGDLEDVQASDIDDVDLNDSQASFDKSSNLIKDDIEAGRVELSASNAEIDIDAIDNGVAIEGDLGTNADKYEALAEAEVDASNLETIQNYKENASTNLESIKSKGDVSPEELNKAYEDYNKASAMEVEMSDKANQSIETIKGMGYEGETSASALSSAKSDAVVDIANQEVLWEADDISSSRTSEIQGDMSASGVNTSLEQGDVTTTDMPSETISSGDTEVDLSNIDIEAGTTETIGSGYVGSESTAQSGVSSVEEGRVTESSTRDASRSDMAETISSGDAEVDLTNIDVEAGTTETIGQVDIPGTTAQSDVSSIEEGRVTESSTRDASRSDMAETISSGDAEVDLTNIDVEAGTTETIGQVDIPGTTAQSDVSSVEEGRVTESSTRDASRSDMAETISSGDAEVDLTNIDVETGTTETIGQVDIPGTQVQPGVVDNDQAVDSQADGTVSSDGIDADVDLSNVTVDTSTTETIGSGQVSGQGDVESSGDIDLSNVDLSSSAEAQVDVSSDVGQKDSGTVVNIGDPDAEIESGDDEVVVEDDLTVDVAQDDSSTHIKSSPDTVVVPGRVDQSSSEPQGEVTSSEDVTRSDVSDSDNRAETAHIDETVMVDQEVERSNDTFDDDIESDMHQTARTTTDYVEDATLQHDQHIETEGASQDDNLTDTIDSDVTVNEDVRQGATNDSQSFNTRDGQTRTVEQDTIVNENVRQGATNDSQSSNARDGQTRTVEQDTIVNENVRQGSTNDTQGSNAGNRRTRTVQQDTIVNENVRQGSVKDSRGTGTRSSRSRILEEDVYVNENIIRDTSASKDDILEQKDDDDETGTSSRSTMLDYDMF